MTRALSDVLTDVTRALSASASSTHAKAHAQKNPAVRAAMLEDADRIEALEGEVRVAAQAQADADARLRAENAALRRKLSRVRSVHVYMAETTARRVPESFFDALAQLDRVLSEPLHDPQTGNLLPLPNAWTPEEEATLRAWVALLAPDCEGSVRLTRDRDADATLSLAEMLAPDWSRGRIAPELSGLVQVSVPELLLFRQAFLAALGAGGKR
ncbi:hypothetical protein [Deinococcus soli (ex Cha et al. 2016)]|uniref:Uncharacterized protein n=2 Tax=Deinococcus soli (ex Cha et al. 2016) TaxID=1309411 RepID=A0ACC6KKG0_9DEIO|nr:hypothetical protein [Deinococcus soli (ex Cha et al. 2016)]MDR6218605.1 hypothetical protein [Deinococcus soli (ex Cha et al. 2016)]MDR6328402.1 hypothetical protein [Deinococcus soli (ex Cha et al. 2016)]MDR6753013.1 hypothetical protein [Deinococcus soli (ex Cha et al. 2016)]